MGCLDTAGGQATGSDKDQVESSITGPSAKQNTQTLLLLHADGRKTLLYYDVLQGRHHFSILSSAYSVIAQKEIVPYNSRYFLAPLEVVLTA